MARKPRARHSCRRRFALPNGTCLTAPGCRRGLSTFPTLTIRSQIKGLRRSRQARATRAYRPLVTTHGSRHGQAHCGQPSCGGCEPGRGTLRERSSTAPGTPSARGWPTCWSSPLGRRRNSVARDQPARAAMAPAEMPSAARPPSPWSASCWWCGAEPHEESEAGP